MTPDKPGRGIALVLVEDNPSVLELRADLFTSLGCDVRKARSLEEARAALADIDSIDVLVTDVNLGPTPNDQSGLEVVAEAARARSDLPIVVYSGVFSEGELPIAEHPEVAQWLVKGSLGVRELGQAMEAVVELGRRARSRREQ